MAYRPRGRKNNSCAGLQESRVKLKVEALGVVELPPLLVLPPAVNTVVEVALVDPVLQERQETHWRPSRTDSGLQVQPAGISMIR